MTRRPGPRPLTVEHRKVTATIMGEAQLNTFAVMAAVAGRRWHQLLNDIVLDAIREAQRDPELQRIVRDMKRFHRGISVVREVSS